MAAQNVTTEMKHIRLGRSGLNVSRIAFGTWQLGGDWGATDEVRGDSRDPARARTGHQPLRHRPGLWFRRV